MKVREGKIYTDNGAKHGNRTRYFRDAPEGGVEWIYAVDYAGPYPRWYGYGMTKNTIAELIKIGMPLEPIDQEV